MNLLLRNVAMWANPIILVATLWLVSVATFQQPYPTTPNFDGVWNTHSAGESGVLYPAWMRLEQSGNKVTGTYEHAGGTISGIVTGNVLRGTWSQTDGRKGAIRFALSDDGKSFKGFWSRGNDPDQANLIWNGERKGGVTPSVGNTGIPAGFKLPEPGTGEFAMRFDPPKYPPAPLPLPPVGARNGSASALLLTQSELYTEWPSGEVQAASDLRLLSVTATHTGGNLKVDVELSKAEPYSHIDIYVSGYIKHLTNKQFGTFASAGIAAAYAYVRNGERTARRSQTFPVPHVLPAKIRVELYETPLDKPRRFVAQKEIVFDIPSWKDYAPVMGGIFGDKEKGIITKVASVVTPGTTNWLMTIPRSSSKADDVTTYYSMGRSFNSNETSFVSNEVIDLGPSMRWKETRVSVLPTWHDRDHRNNWIWPNLPNKGYVDAEPVWVGY